MTAFLGREEGFGDVRLAGFNGLFDIVAESIILADQLQLQGGNVKDLSLRGKKKDATVKHRCGVRPVVEKDPCFFGIVEDFRRKNAGYGQEFHLRRLDLAVDFISHSRDHGELLPGNGLLELLLEIPRRRERHERQSDRRQ